MKEMILSLDELDGLCQSMPNEGIVFLCGDLASGKTSLVKALARFRGIKENVSSPTFSIMQSYENDKGFKIFHYDIYQKGFEALLENGLFENLFEEGLHLIEWGDEKLLARLKSFDMDVLRIKISTVEDKRKYEIEKL